MADGEERRLYLRATLKVMAAVMALALLLAFCAPMDTRGAGAVPRAPAHLAAQ